MITKKRIIELVLIWCGLIAFIILLSSCEKEPINPFEGQSIKGIWNVESLNGSSSILKKMDFKESSVDFILVPEDTIVVTYDYSLVNDVLILNQDTFIVEVLDVHNLTFKKDDTEIVATR